MKPRSFMFVAGEPSGDLLAAELIGAIRAEIVGHPPRPSQDSQPLRTDLAPRFFGAGGAHMKNAGVELAFDLTRHSVIGLSDVFRQYRTFRRLFQRLVRLACERQPDVIVCVDFQGFNRRFIHAVRRRSSRTGGIFNNWNPRIVQYVSPQVWASRPERAYQLERDLDLLLSIFPFEKAWYARRTPRLNVKFVGHPLLDRYEPPVIEAAKPLPEYPLVLLLPGSRRGELRRHIPLLLEAATLIEASRRCRFRMVVPSEEMVDEAQRIAGSSVLRTAATDEDGTSNASSIPIHAGHLPAWLRKADLALTKTGTVTMECACFGVPAVAFYKTSRLTYEVGRRIVRVSSLSMPNLLAGDTVFPEFIQSEATPQNVAESALELLDNPSRRAIVKSQLARVVASLGTPGASKRAAQAVVSLLR